MNNTAAAAAVHWLNLPPELWQAIGKRLDNHIDAVRYRSVCRSWRSSLPLSDGPSLSEFPSPINSANLSVDAYLYQSAIYRLSPIDQEPNPYSSASNSNGRLIKVEKIEVGKMRYLHPLVKRRTRYCSDYLPKEQKELNLLDIRIQELAKSYSLRYNDEICVPGISKVVVYLNPAVTDLTIIAVYEEGKLGFCRCGDENWTLIDDQNFNYDDVISDKGQYYAVNQLGAVFWINSSMESVPFSPPSYCPGHQKHLVECGGELYVVDRFLNTRVPYLLPKGIDFKVHKLDEEWGKWVEIQDLGNRSIVLGNDCSFSVSASEFEGCRRNCIYFTDYDDDHGGTAIGCTRVFDLQERKMDSIYGKPGIDIFRLK